MMFFIVLVSYFNLASSWLTIDDLPILGEVGCNKCERVYAPVCASDNRTYTNECRMNCHNFYKHNYDRVHIKRYGRCVLGNRRSGTEQIEDVDSLRRRARESLNAWKKNNTMKTM